VSTIHDLGYQRYAGVRRHSSTRWRVIMRHQIAMAWKTWWRFKAWLGMAVLVTFIAGAVMYIFSNRTFHGMRGIGGVALLVEDVALPESIGWYCRAAFLTSLTLGAIEIAGDLQSGAFTFYFARSVRARDYVLGKLAGLGAIMGIITLVGPVLLAALRLGLCDPTSDLVDHLVLLPKALLVGALATLAYTAVPLGFSALADNRRTALAMWAAYYLIGGTVAFLIGRISHAQSISALYLPNAIEGIATRLFGVSLFGTTMSGPSIAACVTSLVVQSAAAIAILAVSIDRAQKTGVGGAT
jgi:hypothetical protein